MKQTLADTIPLMQSADYQDRFRAEYEQLTIRAKKLEFMIGRYERNELDFTPKTPLPLLRAQFSSMATYLDVLDYRAEIEGINLNAS
ncbi:MAG: hypothetical protein LKJ05_02865 [Bifidobacteriaceae bacterium]|jgi:hypothetical protein|nr:hypothetical protein [Bifidobacteriaceae bacterium]